MYSRVGTVIALLVGAFPFVALGYKLFEGQTTVTSGVVYAVIVLVLVVSLFIASRLNIVLSPSATTASGTRTPRRPAPPITWSWDGVDRQPEGDDQETDDWPTREHEA
jgi:hypothetical protein